MICEKSSKPKRASENRDSISMWMVPSVLQTHPTGVILTVENIMTSFYFRFNVKQAEIDLRARPNIFLFQWAEVYKIQL